MYDIPVGFFGAGGVGSSSAGEAPPMQGGEILQAARRISGGMADSVLTLGGFWRICLADWRTWRTGGFWRICLADWRILADSLADWQIYNLFGNVNLLLIRNLKIKLKQRFC